MKYVTISMLAVHARRHHTTIRRALTASGITVERHRGINGLRILKRDADKFLALHWPEIGPLPEREKEEAR
jgi:hypothetical protein